MDRRLIHCDGRENLLARSFARQHQRVKLLLRDALELPHLPEYTHHFLFRRRWR